MPWLCSPWSGGSTDHLHLKKNFGVKRENLNFLKKWQIFYMRNGKSRIHVVLKARIWGSYTELGSTYCFRPTPIWKSDVLFFHDSICCMFQFENKNAERFWNTHFASIFIRCKIDVLIQAKILWCQSGWSDRAENSVFHQNTFVLQHSFFKTFLLKFLPVQFWMVTLIDRNTYMLSLLLRFFFIFGIFDLILWLKKRLKF